MTTAPRPHTAVHTAITGFREAKCRIAFSCSRGPITPHPSAPGGLFLGRDAYEPPPLLGLLPHQIRGRVHAGLWTVDAEVQDQLA